MSNPAETSSPNLGPLQDEPVPHRVRASGDGRPLLEYLVDTFVAVPADELRLAIEQGRFRLEEDGPVLAVDDPVRFGTTLLGNVPHRTVQDAWLPAPPIDQVLLYKDEHIVAIDKAPGLLSYPIGPRRISALALLRRQLDRMGESYELRPAHRIDRETTGILMMTRNLLADQRIKKAFKERRVQKTYLAIVRGHIAEPCVVDAPIGTDVGGAIRIRMAVRDDGKEARTQVTPLERFGQGRGEQGWTWVEARPLTGRTHQIRLHLAHIGHPLVGDKIYCDDGIAFLRWWDGELDDEDRARLGMRRQALHAWTTSLEHPIDGSPLALRAPVPADMLAFAQARGGGDPG